MAVVGAQAAGRLGSEAARTSVTRVRGGGLSAILLLSLALCLVGYVLADAIGRPALVQCAVALILLGLLRGWISLNRSALTTGSAGIAGSTPRVSLIRVPLSRRGHAVRSQPAPDPPHAADEPLVKDPALHTSLR